MSQVQCPKCSESLPDDYGMISCPKCNSMVFVDMDGMAHFSSGGESSSSNPPSESASFASQEQDATPLEEYSSSPIDNLIGESHEGLGFGFESDEANVANVSNLDMPLPGDPLGTTDFANSEISQGKDGPFLFKILISGIDTKEMRESLRSALEDQRFSWNTNDLMARISKGDLILENLSPVKAVILVNRIKRLPLEISWEQCAISQAEIR